MGDEFRLEMTLTYTQVRVGIGKVVDAGQTSIRIRLGRFFVL
jgi:hypothetical protein